MIDTRSAKIEVPEFDLRIILAFNAALWAIIVAAVFAIF